MARNANKVGVWQSLRNAWKVQDIRKKLVYTFLMLVVFRLVGVIPAPGVDYARVQASMGSNTLPLLDLVNMMTGSNFQNMTIMAMGITPYINSSIIMQLLTIAIPALERLQKSGPEGQKKIAQITRYVTVGLAVVQAIGLVASLGYIKSGWFNTVLVGVSMAGGTALAMWIGERITEKGLGNGISLLIFAGIISNLFTGYTTLIRNAFQATSLTPWLTLLAVLLVAVVMIVLVTFVDMGVRRINVHFAKRVSGRKMYGGQNTHIPIKVNMSGVMPIIFAGSILSIPPTIQMFIPSAKLADSKFWTGFFKVFTSTHWAYGIIYFVLIIAFAYFYSSIQYNPIEMSQNIAKNGGMIPGIRTGRPTSDYIARIISRITLLGALLLSVVAIFPIVFSQLTTLILTKTTVYADGMNVSLGGTSIIILVGVALETVKQLESQMMMRHYKGFLD